MTALRDAMERSGTWLFRRRSCLPLIVHALAVPNHLDLVHPTR